MARAGAAAYRLLRARYAGVRTVGVLCGPGNNGGDGYVVAELARRDGWEVQLAALGAPCPDTAAAQARAAFGGAVCADPGAALAAPVRVDALFGTGLRRAPDGAAAQLIGALNAGTAPTLALDLPSGLDADSGHASGPAVRADATLSFVLPKLGLYTGRARELTGVLSWDDLGIPAEARAAAGDAPAAVLDLEALRRRHLPPRARDAHKGDAGHVLVVGGDHGYGGAARLAGEAALRCGAGLVSVATRAAHVPALLAGRPELMVHAVERAADLEALLARATVVVLGPGLGRRRWGRAMFRAALASDRPLVVDADGLNLLAGRPCRRANWILTPHPGEAGRLLGADAAAVQADRYGAVRALVGRYGGVAVLKGAGTLVWDGQGPVAVCPHGGPVLASGGTGDVLTGMVGALLAQRTAPLAAAALGVCLHGAAGDRLARARGERGLLAGDLIDVLPDLLDGRDRTHV